jgi:hypothetical protein
VDVGSAVVQYTSAQVLTQIQTRVVASTEKMAQTVATLVADSIVR